jgi:hypothetical protein
LTLPLATWTVQRVDEKDATRRRYEITPEKGAKTILLVDAAGFPLEVDTSFYGSSLRFRKL